MIGCYQPNFARPAPNDAYTWSKALDDVGTRATCGELCTPVAHYGSRELCARRLPSCAHVSLQRPPSYTHAWPVASREWCVCSLAGPTAASEHTPSLHIFRSPYCSSGGGFASPHRHLTSWSLAHLQPSRAPPPVLESLMALFQSCSLNCHLSLLSEQVGLPIVLFEQT